MQRLKRDIRIKAMIKVVVNNEGTLKGVGRFAPYFVMGVVKG
jgi:hypothetical protein